MVATDVASRGIGMNKSQTPPPLPPPPFLPSFLASRVTLHIEVV